MSLDKEFKQAFENSKNLSARPSNDVLLEMYSLYKQATEGDISGERPGGFDFKAIAKYDAWAERKGMTKENAMQQYVSLIQKLSASN
ncbi:MAG: acyl-CoA-binding protein [Flammeovirgaceae bacterium]|nr:acyl-CoA-binding protein [Flammeovirgaceae bacterium]